MTAFICLLATLGGVYPTTPDLEVKAVVLRPMRDVDVPAQETGPLTELPVEEGQVVEEGALLARIDDADAGSAVAEATADYEVATVEATSNLAIESAEADLTAANKKLKSAEASRLKYEKAVKAYEMDELQLAVTQAKLAVERAKLVQEKAAKSAAAKSERVKRAKEKLKRHQVVSPISGSVVECKFEQGEWVEAGQVIARVVQTERLRIEGLIDPSQALPSLIGSRVTVTVPLGGKTIRLPGTLSFISSEAHPTAHTVRIRAIVENKNGLVRPGIKNCSLTIHRRPITRVGQNR
ncbi:MAG: efflux RND transporter periplasmic adaptor subunit [Planctomycetaceae bacterium]